jgi:energy-coupling factor transport system substrate-specific component
MRENNKGDLFFIFVSRICIGALVYGLLNALSGRLLLPTASFITLRPQVSLPMFIGIAYGPLSGFLTGLTGNLFGDIVCGYGPITFWHWHIANGLMGLIPGLIRYLDIEKVKSIRDFGIVEAAVVIASGVAVGLAVIVDLLLVHEMHLPGSINAWILPAFLTDALNGFIIVPVLLLVFKKLVVTVETRTIMMVTLLLVVTVLSTAMSITWSVWGDLTSRESMVRAFYFAGIVSLFVLVLGLLVSIILSKRVTDPVLKLTEAAGSVEKGEYDLRDLDDLSERPDEFGYLSRVIQEMADEIRGREQRLKKQVQELRIEIDKVSQAKEVAQIVETDYFKSLRDKVKKFRRQ